MNNYFGLSILKLFPLLSILESYKINKTEFLESCGIEPVLLESPDNRIGFSRFTNVIRKALKATGDKNLGLHMGQAFTGFSNILGYVLMNCSNLKEVLNKHIKYEKITNDIFSTGSRLEKGKMIITCRGLTDFKELEEFFYTLHFSITMKYPKILCKDFSDKYVKYITFTFNKPENISEYDNIFRCPVYFNKLENSMVLDAESGELEVNNSNKDLLAVFEKHADTLLKKLNSLKTYSGRTSEIIIKKLKGVSPKISNIAGELALSTRTLQMKLKDEGTSYSELLDSIRKELAINYIKDKYTPISEIAYLLGFSEASVFHRCFKKWTNTTPLQYRNNYN
jgi:AraC-like DNA-binding protein